jgi:hypothetical protein
MHLCFDASDQIPETAPQGFDSCLGYIGGAATHIWTLDEWDRFSHLRQFPAWVARFGNPITEANNAVAAAKALGWRKQRAIIADMEAVIDVSWWNSFAAAISLMGFEPVWYGSLSVAGHYSAGPHHRWLKYEADWDGKPEIDPGFAAKQYLAGIRTADGGLVDVSNIGDELYHMGGVGARRTTSLITRLFQERTGTLRPAEASTATQTGVTVMPNLAKLRADLEQVVDRHEAEIEAILSGAETVADSPVSKAVAAAVHVPPSVLEDVAATIVNLEREFAAAASSAPSTPAPVDPSPALAAAQAAIAQAQQPR